MTQLKRVLLTFFFTILSYFSLVMARTPMRAGTDEMLPAVDIYTILSKGVIRDTAYVNGTNFQYGASILISITGLTYERVARYAPFLGALTFLIITLCLYAIYIHETSYPTPRFIAAPLSLLVFGGFVLRLTGFTHKLFTFVMILVGLLLAHRLLTPGKDRRDAVLLSLIIFSLCLLNYMWGVIYGLAILASLAVARDTAHLRILPLPILGSYLAAIHLPTVEIPLQYYVNANIGPLLYLLRYQKLPSATSGRGMGATSQIAGWPSLTVFNHTISVWFIWASGIFLVAAVSIIALAIALRRYWIGRSDAIEHQLLGFVAVMGFVMIALISSGDIPTIKRIVVFPAMIALLYITIHFDEAGTVLSVNRQSILSILVVLLLIGSVLAVPRVTVNGGEKPVDPYAEQSDIAKVFWAENHFSHCLAGSKRMDETIRAKEFGKRFQYLERRGDQNTVIYSSPGGNLFYMCSDY